MRLDQAKKEDNKFTTEKLMKLTPSPGEKNVCNMAKTQYANIKILDEIM